MTAPDYTCIPAVRDKVRAAQKILREANDDLASHGLNDTAAQVGSADKFLETISGPEGVLHFLEKPE